MPNFDKTLPIGSKKLRLSDDDIRQNMDALEDALVRSGMKFPTEYGIDAGEFLVPTFQNQAADPATPAANKLKFYAKTLASQPRFYIKDPAGSVKALAVVGEDIIPSGTKMLFYQDTAPSGWTIQDTLDDKLVYITKGSAAGGEIGGTVHSTGSWTISGFDANVGNHTLTIAEMPAHNHPMGNVGGYNAVANAGYPSPHGTGYSATVYVADQGGGGAHNHPMASHAGTWRPSAYCCIICEKQ